MVKIEKGIPFPATGPLLGGNLKWPWPDMEVGDSFYVSHHDVPGAKDGDHLKKRLQASAYGWANRRQWLRECAQRRGESVVVFREKFVVIEQENGVRVWRFEDIPESCIG